MAHTMPQLRTSRAPAERHTRLSTRRLDVGDRGRVRPSSGFHAGELLVPPAPARQVRVRGAWVEAAFLGGATLPMTAQEVLALRERLFAALEPYIARLSTPSQWPEGHRFVRIVLAGTPAGTEPEEQSP